MEELLNIGIFLTGALAAGVALIEFFNRRSESREERLQNREHELKKQVNVLEKDRVDSLFAAMACAMKQLQDQSKEDRKERQEFHADLRGHRSDLQALHTVTKLEMDHIKACLADVREEVKSVVKYIGEGNVRVSGKKF